MIFQINEIVYLNGEILTNRYPRGDIGVNDIKTIFANNIKGTVFSIELPSFMNKGQFLYTIKIFENLYGIEIVQRKISKYPTGTGTGTDGLVYIGNKPVLINTTTNQYIPKIPNGIGFNQLNNLDEYNALNKLNFINKEIEIQNTINSYNLNSDKNVQKTISKYFYYKFIDEWLYKELFPLLAFVEIIDGKPQLIKSMDKYSIERLASESEAGIEKRVGYFESEILTKKLIKQILKKIVKRMCINWYDLEKKENMVRKVFLEYFKNLLEESINKFI